MPVTVPASSANLGAGFDALGVALDLRAVIGLADEPPVARAEPATGGHPAAVAFAAAGGTGGVWVRSPIPPGRGLGFSGAMRVGATVAAWIQRGGDPAALDDSRRQALMEVPARLEGHPDNAAASMFGGFTVASGDTVARIPTALRPAIVVWVPQGATTSTEHSRGTLDAQISRQDAAFNIGRAALAVAALAGGRADLLRTATEDRLHQARRLAAAPASRAVFETWQDSAAWAVWLSGSGPSVAACCDPADAEAVAAAVPGGGWVKVLGVDQHGARWEGAAPLR